MPTAVLRSLTAMVRFAPLRPRPSAIRPRATTPTVVGEPLEERRLLALAVSPVGAGTSAATLGAALLVPGSGITITGGTYVGANNQGGTYTGFDTTSTFGQRLQIP